MFQSCFSFGYRCSNFQINTLLSPLMELPYQFKSRVPEAPGKPSMNSTLYIVVSHSRITHTKLVFFFITRHYFSQTQVHARAPPIAHNGETVVPRTRTQQIKGRNQSAWCTAFLKTQTLHSKNSLKKCINCAPYTRQLYCAPEELVKGWPSLSGHTLSGNLETAVELFITQGFLCVRVFSFLFFIAHDMALTLTSTKTFNVLVKFVFTDLLLHSAFKNSF